MCGFTLEAVNTFDHLGALYCWQQDSLFAIDKDRWQTIAFVSVSKITKASNNTKVVTRYVAVVDLDG